MTGRRRLALLLVAVAAAWTPFVHTAPPAAPAGHEPVAGADHAPIGAVRHDRAARVEASTAPRHDGARTTLALWWSAAALTVVVVTLGPVAARGARSAGAPSRTARRVRAPPARPRPLTATA